MDKKLRVFKLRNQTEEDLGKTVTTLKKELSELRVSKVSGGTAAKLGRIGVVRKAIAKYLTVINEKQRKLVRDQFAKKSRKPLDIRAKRTRAIRRRLSRSQQRQKTDRQWKKEANFPLRKYALKSE